MPALEGSPVYYFISDLHIGGEGNLAVCDFEVELIEFLQSLSAAEQPSELIIVGDAFSFWEMTRTPTLQKLATTAAQHPALFEQFRQTGKSVRITLIPGNHDYELACYPDFVKALANYNIHLEVAEVITREVAGRQIWIEHGHQHDSFNAIADFGNPSVTPLGYYIVSQIVDGLSERSQRGKYPWLKDIESVYPNEEVPYWLFSNYFYKEMSPVLRWALVPFLLLMSVSLFVLIGAALERTGILPVGFFSISWQAFLKSFGFAGRALDIMVNFVLLIDSLFIAAAILVLIPVLLIFRDLRKTLRNYGFQGHKGLKNNKESLYIEAAKAVFERSPNTVLFIYGHTHQPSLIDLNNRYVINTGSWLKRLQRIPSRFRFLPGVYYPSFQLNYFKISETEEGISLSYHCVSKSVELGLTALENFAIWGRETRFPIDIPPHTTIAQ